VQRLRSKLPLSAVPIQDDDGRQAASSVLNHESVSRVVSEAESRPDSFFARLAYLAGGVGGALALQWKL